MKEKNGMICLEWIAAGDIHSLDFFYILEETEHQLANFCHS